MERKEIRVILQSLGMSEKLLEKPAVMERIYPLFSTTEDIEDIINLVKIEDDGKDICIDGKHFVEQESGETLLSYLDDAGDDVLVKIDKYGMDSKYTAGDDLFSSVNMTRQNDRQLLIESHNEGRATIDKIYKQDDGDAVLNYYNYTIFKEKATTTLGWEGNKEYLTKEYPITKEWFEQREKTMQEKDVNNEIENDVKISPDTEEETEKQEMLDIKIKLETQEQLIKDLMDREKTIISENKELKHKNERLQKMLDATLEFCKKVQKSKVGKFFFKKQLLALPEAREEEGR